MESTIHIQGIETAYRNKAGQRHRIDGPAMIWEYGKQNGTQAVKQAWYINGQLHRTDGPAVIELNNYNEYHFEWWIDGKQITKHKHKLLIA